MLKTWGEWDSSFRLAVNKSLDRTFTAADGSEINVKPGYDLNTALGFGWTPGLGNWRLGLMLNPVYSSPTNIGKYKLVWNSSVDASYLIARRYLVGLTYNDQTLMGPAKNTTLERGLRAFLRIKWER